MVSTDLLLSGFMGAIVAVGLSILYHEYKLQRQKRHALAKERLEKVYGPLMLILRAHNAGKDADKQEFGYFKEEEKFIDALLLKYYYLIEEKRKLLLLDLYKHRKFATAYGQEIVIAIKEGYKENIDLLNKSFA